jgi:uncharacterized protein (DUF1810 family)
MGGRWAIGSGIYSFNWSEWGIVTTLNIMG